MNLLYLTIEFPLIGFFILTFFKRVLSKNWSAVIGVSSIGLSCFITLLIIFDFYSIGIENNYIFKQTLWTWASIGNSNFSITLILDKLSLIILSIVTIVGFLIHLYSIWYMNKEKDYSRFFSYTNLFIASMILLILADNMIFLYFGWELVGICSYLLIGFYYLEPKNGKSAMESFLITHIGDMFLLISILIFYYEFKTVNFQEINILSLESNIHSSCWINLISVLILIGTLGKSAQIPLQTWLPKAMVGPTPISALIHATTMVISGVYLICRTNILFLMAPKTLLLIAIIGTITLVIAASAALVQTNIKRILAYSTISQIGYMFLALGIRAFDAAVFHLIIHAFFKSLLFLSSGIVINCCKGEQNIFKMGGLYKVIPTSYICFLIGGGALSAFPIITSGFYSKDRILLETILHKHSFLFLGGVLGSFLTTLYVFRMIFVVFHREQKIKFKFLENRMINNFPLCVLAILSTFVGALIIKKFNWIFFLKTNHSNHKDIILDIILGIITLVGIILAKNYFLKIKGNITQPKKNKIFKLFKLLFSQEFGLKNICNTFFVFPFKKIAKFLKNDPINFLMNISFIILMLMNKNLAFIQNGKLYWYLIFMGFGAILTMLTLLFLTKF